MQALILSSLGSGGSFLELVLPIWVIITVFYLIDFVIRFIKKKRLQYQDKLVNDLTAQIDNTTQTDNTI